MFGMGPMIGMRSGVAHRCEALPRKFCLRLRSRVCAIWGHFCWSICMLLMCWAVVVCGVVTGQRCGIKVAPSVWYPR